MTASPTDDLASAERAIQELTKELSQARGELVEAREQQATTAKILSVISGSRGELHRVFAALAVDAADFAMPLTPPSIRWMGKSFALLLTMVRLTSVPSGTSRCR